MLKILSCLNPILLLVAFIYLVKSLRLIRGSRLEGILYSLGFFIAILLFKASRQVAQIPGVFNFYLDELNFSIILEGIAYLGLIVCSFFIFRNYKRSFVSNWEKFLVLLLLVGAMGLVALSCQTLLAYFGTNPYTLKTSLLIGMGLFMAVILIPTYFNYFRTRFFLSWCWIGLSLLLLTLVNYLQMVVETRSLGPLLLIPTESFRTFSFLSLGLALLIYRQAQSRVVLPQHSFTAVKTLSERESLECIVSYFTESLFSLYGAVYGVVNQRGLEKKWSGVAQKEGDAIRLHKGKLQNVKGPVNLLAQAKRLRKYLELSYTMLVDYCGAPFVDKMFRQLTQELYWTEKDIADNHLFLDLPFGKKFISEEEEKEISLDQLLEENPLFYSLTQEERKFVAQRFKRKTFRKRKRIIRQGTKGDEFFLLASGECTVVQKRGWKKFRLVRLRQGDTFGERALLEDAKRSATVKAKTRVVTYILKKEDFLDLLKTYFDVLPKMKQSFERGDFLSQIPLFSPFSQIQLLYMASRMSLRQFRSGETVLKLGEPGETFYVIERGEAEVYLPQLEGAQTIAHLGKGECFGEMALLKTGVRTASVRARSDLICLELRKSDFDQIFGGCHYRRKKLEKLIMRREEDLSKKQS